MKPKQIRSVIRSSGRVPAQRSTTYKILKLYPNADHDDSESALDIAEPTQFGSFHELIKLDEFRYRRKEKSANCS
jgi:FO synthase subunit 2